MAWVKLDENYQFDPKILAAGALAELLYVRSLAWAKRFWKDEGRIDARHLAPLVMGMPGKPATHIAALVDNELWTVVDGGWLITAWAKRNNTADAIEKVRNERRIAGAKGLAKRYANGLAKTLPEAASETETEAEAAAEPAGLSPGAAAALDFYAALRTKIKKPDDPVAYAASIRLDEAALCGVAIEELAARGEPPHRILELLYGVELADLVRYTSYRRSSYEHDG